MAKAKDAMKLSDATLLRRARAAVQRGWTKAGFWVGRGGGEVDVPEQVCRVCTAGACHLVVAARRSHLHDQPARRNNRAHRLLNFIRDANPAADVITSSYSRVSKRTVLRWFDNAIALARRAEKRRK